MVSDHGDQNAVATMETKAAISNVMVDRCSLYPMLTLFQPILEIIGFNE
jgi:hypothetical protein